MNEIAAAVIGALVGGLVAWLVTKKQIDETRRMARDSTQRERVWDIAQAVSLIQGEILSQSTPEALREPDDVNRLEWEWDKAHRRLHILGYEATAKQLTVELKPYLQLLRQFLSKGVERRELDERRRMARNRVTDVMSEFTKSS